MIYRGFLSKSPEGRTRVLLRDDPDRSFVDVDTTHVREVQLVDDPQSALAVWAVHVLDGASVSKGLLDSAEFDELFAWAGDMTTAQPMTFPSRPGTTCGAHDSSTRMGVCVPC